MQNVSDIKYSNYIRESFSPNQRDSAYYMGFHNGIYESMHHFDGYRFLDDILSEIKNIAKSVEERNTSVCLNRTVLCDEFRRNLNPDLYIKSNRLMNKVIDADWCWTISFAGMIVIADDIGNAVEIYRHDTNGECPSAMCLTDFDSGFCAINCMCIGFVDGELVNLYSDVPLKEMLYHECMHAYCIKFI